MRFSSLRFLPGPGDSSVCYDSRGFDIPLSARTLVDIFAVLVVAVALFAAISFVNYEPIRARIYALQRKEFR